MESRKEQGEIEDKIIFNMSTKTIILLLIASVFSVIVSTNGARNPDCLLPVETSLCRARMTRWGFDTATQKCKKFIWGGCSKNANSFKTEEDCKATCADESEPAEAEREFVTVTGTCNCECPKCELFPRIEHTGRGFPLFLRRFN